jgi:ribA/ribD-fused uncharacterized protein
MPSISAPVKQPLSVEEYQSLSSKAVKDAMKNKSKEVPLEKQCGKLNGKGKNCVKRGYDKFDGRCSGHSTENLERLKSMAKSIESKKEVPKTKCSHVNLSTHKKAPGKQCKFNTKYNSLYCGRHTPNKKVRKRRISDFEHVLRWLLESVAELKHSGSVVITDDLIKKALVFRTSLKESRANERHKKKSGDADDRHFLDEKEEVVEEEKEEVVEEEKEEVVEVEKEVVVEVEKEEVVEVEKEEVVEVEKEEVVEEEKEEVVEEEKEEVVEEEKELNKKIKKSYVNSDFHFFWGKKSMLSQWYPSEFKDVNGQQYNTSEQYMMVKKAVLFDDTVAAEKLLDTVDPKMCKKIGRKVQGFDAKVWNKTKEKIVLDGNMYKFNQNPRTLEFLLGTGDKWLVEASPYDKVWGIGMDSKNPDCIYPEKWKGLNLLGKALMIAREQLKQR